MFNRVFVSRFGYCISRGEVGAAKIDKTAFLRFFFIGFAILSAVRKLGVENTCRFADLRTFKKKRLEI